MALSPLDDLSPHAERVARRLFGAQPEWRALAEPLPNAEGEGALGDFAVEVPSPAHPDWPLRLSTGGGVVFCQLGRAMCWASWPGADARDPRADASDHAGEGARVGDFSGHAHDAAHDAACDDLLALLDDLLAERLVLVTTFGVPGLGGPHGDPRGGVAALVPYDPATGLAFHDPGLARVEVRSWRGTHDAHADLRSPRHAPPDARA